MLQVARSFTQKLVARLPHDQNARTVALLAAVLAVDQADRGTVGALGPTLEHAFDISHFGLGLLAGAFSVVSAIATVPVGVLTDRVRRVSLLAASVILWTVAMAIGGFAVSFTMLLVSRMFLGVVTATGGPTISSLIGDMFERRERARILARVQTGEYVGIGAGFLAVGAIVAALSWRFVYWMLAAIGAVLAVALYGLPEPARGAHDASAARGEDDPVVREVRAHEIEPNDEAIVDADPDEMSLPSAMRNVVEIRTNVVVIVASTVGYFFFAGLRLFAVLFATAQYSVSNSEAALLLPVVGIGAVAGLLVGGRIADRLAERGYVSGRIIVAIGGFVLATLAFLPALFTHSLLVALPLLTIGAAGLAAPNPPLDAVRLDVVPPGLWGRAQSVRTLTRTGAEAIGPVVLGLLADHLGGGGARGVQLTLLILVPALLGNGLLLLFAARSYPHDVASELISAQRADGP
jgi:MFS family permease